MSDLDQLSSEVSTGGLTRRDVLRRGVSLGLTAPVIATLLVACGSDDDDSAPADRATPTPGSGADPTETPAAAAEPTPTQESPGIATETPATEPTASQRGRHDLLRLLFWQAPTILNTHLSLGDKDTIPARMVSEPLLDFDPESNLVPILASEVPSLEGGGVSPDGMSVTYTLKEGVVWSDGMPFTAEDVKFTWEYIMDPASAKVSVNTYSVISSIDVVDDHTLTLHFHEPNPAWFAPFSGGYTGGILPKHLLEDFTGEQASEAPFNMKPVGTGPYIVKEFIPGDLIIFEMNENFRNESQPAFRELEFKGGGDAASAGRAVLQTGETDYAWNLQVEKDVLEQLATGDRGALDVMPWISVEQVLLNFADPNSEIDGARSELSTSHPYLSDPIVRQALNLGIDRDSIAQELWGPGGLATANFLVVPERFVSTDASYEFDLDRANQILDEAGWIRDGNVRVKDGVELRGLLQTTTNTVRNRTQEIIKQSWGDLGVLIDLKSIEASVYFSTDAGNPDTAGKFYADFQMHSTGATNPYPIAFMARFKSVDPESDIAQKSNGWTGTNISRWVNEEYNELWERASTELDPDTQATLFLRMSNLVLENMVVFPMIHRALVAGVSTRLKGVNRAPLTVDTWNIEEWHFDE